MQKTYMMVVVAESKGAFTENKARKIAIIGNLWTNYSSGVRGEWR